MANRKAITFFILVSLLFSPLNGNFAFAKFEIKDEYIAQINTSLNILNILDAFGIKLLPKELKNVLNTTVKGVNVGADITYGVLVLIAWNEMELIDMVTSQSYKTKSDAYFKSILDERTSIYKNYEGLLPDIFKVLSGTITGPISALSLSTFSLESKTIETILALYNLNQTMVYNGLWEYFDAKRSNESHETAWELARLKMGIGIRGSDRENLSLQFRQLWEKWGDKTTTAGVKPEIKKQFNEEMQKLVLEATATYAQQKPEPSFIAKISSAITSFVRNIVEKTKNMASDILNSIKEIGLNIVKFNPFSAGLSQEQGSNPQSTITQEPSIQIINEPAENPAGDPVQVGLAQEESPSPIPEPKPVVIQPKLEEAKLAEEKPAPLLIKPESPDMGRVERPVSLCDTPSSASPLLNNVIFNEIAWMGTQNSANDEWIELKNISNNPVNLAGWQIRDKDEQIHIAFDATHSIPANGFFLLERTDDNTLPHISADMLYKGALSNTNEELFLLDKNCAIQDRVQASPNWPAGETSSKQTMERRSNLSWQTSASTGGTPKQENGAGFIPFMTDSSAGAQGSPTLTLPTTYSALLITEIQTAGQSSQTEEFVELYNPTSQSVDMTEWYLQKKTQSASSFSTFASKTLFAGKQISSNGYLLIAREGSSFASNADILVSSSLADNNTLALKNPNGDITDKVGWGEAQDSETSSASNPPSGNSIARIYNAATETYQDTNSNANDFIIFNAPTPKTKNIAVVQQTQNQAQAQTENSSPSSSEPPQPSPSVASPPAPVPSRIVVFNEIAWAGTAISASDEWIELASTTSTAVDLIGWKIEAEDGTPTIELSGAIAPGGYFLLERTDNTTISNIAADLIYTGALENEGEKLRLYDPAGVLIDEVDASAGWFAGNNITKQSMERIGATGSGSDPSNWASNNLITHNGKEANGIASINGTPRAQNSVSKTETEITDIRLSEFDSITLTFLGSPYTANDIIVPQNKTLVIEPGVMVRVAQDISSITIHGTLTALGTVQKNITLTGSLSGSSWCGITFSATSANSKLDYITIEKATGCGDQGIGRSIMVDGADITLKHATLTSGDSRRRVYLKNSNSLIDSATISGANQTNNPEAAGILIEGTGNPVITNSTFSNNTIGIWHKSPTANPTISNNTFTGNVYPIKLTSAPATLSANSASENTYNGILLEGAATSDLTLQTDTMPYMINDFTVSAGKTLTLQPGTIMKFGNIIYDNPVLRVNGTLSAQGTQASPITFTGLGDNSVGGTTALNAGQSWRGIVFYPSSTGILEYTTVKKGGTSSDLEGMIHVDQSTVNIRNSTLQQSGKQGVYSSSGTITIQDTTIEVPENSYAFRILIGNCPTLTNVSFTGLGKKLAPNSVECSL